MNHLHLVLAKPGPKSGPRFPLARRQRWRIRLAFILAESGGAAPDAPRWEQDRFEPEDPPGGAVA